MSSTRKTILAVIGFALLLILAAFAYSSLSGVYAKDRSAAAGTVALQTAAPKAAPDFTVFDTAGKAVRLSDYAGRPVVLNFWASWCPPCKSEMPLFNKVYGELQSDVTFLMVDLVDGQRETAAKGLDYVRQQGFAFAPVFDTKQEAAAKYGITAIPTTVFISPKGQILHSYTGAIEEKILRAGIALIRK